jgi:hypothetical protein
MYVYIYRATLTPAMASVMIHTHMAMMVYAARSSMVQMAVVAAKMECQLQVQLQVVTSFF